MRERRRRPDRERGAALVEFALILPLFMMLVLGTFTGGIAYNQKITMTNAAREGSRYASTLPLTNFASVEAWLHDVAQYVEDASEGVLGPGAPGLKICVAYVYDTATKSETHPNPSNVYSSAKCFSDGRPNTERRVQVSVERQGKLEALVFSQTLTLRSKSITKFEAVS